MNLQVKGLLDGRWGLDQHLCPRICVYVNICPMKLLHVNMTLVMSPIGICICMSIHQPHPTAFESHVVVFSFSETKHFKISSAGPGTSLQLDIQMGLGPFQSQGRRIPLLDLRQQLEAVLQGLPFVSQGSRDKAPDSAERTLGPAWLQNSNGVWVKTKPGIGPQVLVLGYIYHLEHPSLHKFMPLAQTYCKTRGRHQNLVNVHFFLLRVIFPKPGWPR